MRPKQELLELEEKFVRLRISNMADVDIGKFEFDFDTTFAVMVLNKDGQIISRYGGRDAQSPESFITLPSLKKALVRSLDLHQKSQENLITLPKALKSRQAQSYPFVANVAMRCVHCHDVASAQAFEMFESPSFDLAKDIWIHPEPISLGLDLDPDDGATLLKATGLAKEAGLTKGDRILSVNDIPVSTFTDIQYQLHRLSVDTESVKIGIKDKKIIALKLRDNWKHSDITWRRLGIRLEPSAGFGGTPLSAKEKAALKLPTDGFAVTVSFLNFPKPENTPLKDGDIVFSVNKVEKSELTQHAALHINLTHQLDEVLQLGVIREGERQVIPLTVSEGASDNRRVMDSDSRMGRMMRGGRGMGRGRGRGRTGREGGRMRGRNMPPAEKPSPETEEQESK